MQSTKQKITCYECGSSHFVDLSKVPAQKQYLKCLKCGVQMPILRRLVDAGGGGSAHSSFDKPEEIRETPGGLDASAYEEEPWEGCSSEAEEGEQGNWIATFADMVSILLIFFILMFAISSVDKKKFQIIMQSINNALGGNLTFTEEAAPIPSSEVDITKVLEELRRSARQERDAFSELRKQLESFITEHKLQNMFSLINEDEGLVLIAPDMTMFDSGSPEIREEILSHLRKIGLILFRIKNDIVVEGHTDDVPIRSARFSSNWELSVMRATNVIHFLLEECGLDATRLSAAGYAYYRPRYNMGSPEKAKNRRIEVKIKKKYSEELSDELLRSD